MEVTQEDGGGGPGRWRWPRKMEAAQGDRDGSRGWRKKRRWGGREVFIEERRGCQGFRDLADRK